MIADRMSSSSSGTPNTRRSLCAKVHDWNRDITQLSQLTAFSFECGASACLERAAAKRVEPSAIEARDAFRAVRQRVRLVSLAAVVVLLLYQFQIESMLRINLHSMRPCAAKERNEAIVNVIFLKQLNFEKKEIFLLLFFALQFVCNQRIMNRVSCNYENNARNE